jgi:anti-sigma factor RsiW
MQCGVARKYLYPLESSGAEPPAFPAPPEVTEARAHVVDCAACREFFAAERRLKVFLSQRTPRARASAALRENLLAGIAEERERSARSSHGFGRTGQRRPVLALVGLLALSALISGLWLSRRGDRAMLPELVSVLIDDHVRSSPGVTEIASSDHHVVEAWFRGKVDFTFRLPPVAGPQLIGGRLCHLQGRRAALIFFEHPQRPVSLFIFDGGEVELPEDHLITLDGKRCLVEAKKGHNLVLWKERGLLYGLVSDASSADLLQLAAKFE